MKASIHQLTRLALVAVISAMFWFAGGVFSSSTLAGQDAQELVKVTTDQVMTKLKQEQDSIKNDPDRVYTLVNEIVLPHFDFDAMSSWVLGKYWRTANSEQKQRFTKEFSALLVRTYSKALQDNVDRKVDILPLREKADTDDVTVRTEVQQDAGFPIPINYKLHVKNGEWKVYDVVIDDISLVANYRTSFGKEVKESGIDQLIARLSDKNTTVAPAIEVGGKK